jgi:hypothetical protein
MIEPADFRQASLITLPAIHLRQNVCGSPRNFPAQRGRANLIVNNSRFFVFRGKPQKV